MIKKEHIFSIFGSAGYFCSALIIFFIMFLAIGYISSDLLSNQDRIREHIREDLVNVIAARSAGDIHTECLVLSGAIAPSADSLHYILDPKMLVSADPCVGLQDALSDKKNINWVSYSRYWMGSIYLSLIALNFLNLSDIHSLYKVLLTGSIIAFGVSGFIGLRRDLRIPLLLTSLGLYAGIGITRFGGHLGHSPVYFLSLYALAALIAVRFKAAGRREASIIGCVLGNIVGYYDILSGAIPLMASLSVFSFYLIWKNHARQANDIREFIVGIIILLSNYLASIIMIMIVKQFCFVVILHRPDAITDFIDELTLRMSDAGVPGNAVSNVLYVFRRLWWNNGAVYVGGQISSNIIFFLGFISWLFVTLFSIKKFLNSRNVEEIVDFSVIFMVSFIIIIWFLIFRNHGYWHAWFMTRILCVIPTFGIVAAWMAGREIAPRRKN